MVRIMGKKTLRRNSEGMAVLALLCKRRPTYSNCDSVQLCLKMAVDGKQLEEVPPLPPFPLLFRCVRRLRGRHPGAQYDYTPLEAVNMRHSLLKFRNTTVVTNFTESGMIS